MFESWYFDELISKKIRDIWKLTDHFLLKHIDNIVIATGIKEVLKERITIDDIIKKKGYSENVKSSVKWILDRLVLDGFISCDNGYYFLNSKKIDFDLTDIRNQALNEASDSVAAFNMLELMAKNYPDFLAGKKNGVDIIFAPENVDITNEYYSNNLFYNVHNIAGAKIINYDIEKRTNPLILEFGGGMGGGTKQFVIQRLKDNKSLTNFTYIFTDVANKMLRTTRKDLSLITDKLESFDFKKLNFNNALKEQGYEENSIDVMWGVNAAHVAYDLRFTLSEIYKTLKPGGSLIICETVRPRGNTMIQQEFLLNTLPDYWNVKLDEEIRPRYGFMDWQNWISALKASGFVNVETIPDMSVVEEKYDNCYVAVIRGMKPL